MGLISNVMGAIGDSASSVIADQYVEFFTCDSLGQDVLVRQGARKMQKGHNKGDVEVITNGAMIAVPENTACLMVDNGKVVDFTIQAGMYTWDSSSAPSVFAGNDGFLDAAKKLVGETWNRMKAGGEITTQQRIYFVNMLEIRDQKYGTPSALPYHDPEYRNIYIRLNGAFSYHIQEHEYEDSLPKVFTDVNFSIPKLSCTAITGVTGSGKSTLFKLLMSFFSLQRGEKILCTKDRSEIPLDSSYRRLFAYVPQGNQLMTGTIREMVTFGTAASGPDVEEKIWIVLEEACAKEFVQALPDGLDTPIKERGAGLSEGQLQRIAIARALYTERPILLLDEATSALDENTEQELLLHLKEMTDRTILFVTHRLNALSICDKEIHINGTKVSIRDLHRK